MQKLQIVITIIIVALALVCAFSIYRVACYVTGKCPGDRSSYVTYAALALTSLYFLAVTQTFLAKAQIQKK